MSDRSIRGSDRGVSDVLGYVLIFGLVVSSIGLVAFGGLDSLAAARDNQQTQTAERAYEILTKHMQDIFMRNAPSRATEITLGPATMKTGSLVTFDVTLTDPSGATVPGVNPPKTFEVRPLIYETPDGQKLVYVNGATFRTTPDGGGVVLNDPPIKVIDSSGGSSDRVLMPMVVTASGDESISGGKGLIRGKLSTSQLVFDGEFQDVELTVTSPRADLWKRTLEKEGFSCGSVTNSVTCTFDPSGDIESLFLTVHRINVNLEQ